MRLLASLGSCCCTSPGTQAGPALVQDQPFFDRMCVATSSGSAPGHDLTGVDSVYQRRSQLPTVGCRRGMTEGFVWGGSQTGLEKLLMAVPVPPIGFKAFRTKGFLSSISQGPRVLFRHGIWTPVRLFLSTGPVELWESIFAERFRHRYLGRNNGLGRRGNPVPTHCSSVFLLLFAVGIPFGGHVVMNALRAP